jgi:DNA-binding IclR family transcriptional regulator
MMMTSGDRILVAMREQPHGGLSAGEIAEHAGMSVSTVRRWLPELFSNHMLVECHYVGTYGLSNAGRTRADEVKARRAEAHA